MHQKNRYWIKGELNNLEYRVWAGLKDRCNNKKSKTWDNYGARGIRYSEEWENFGNFLRDMGNKPSTGKRIVLDRIDNNGPYCKENCRWVDMVTSNQNKRYPKLSMLPRGVMYGKKFRFVARIKADNVMYNIGTFDTKEEASKAYQAWTVWL